MSLHRFRTDSYCFFPTDFLIFSKWRIGFLDIFSLQSPYRSRSALSTFPGHQSWLFRIFCWFSSPIHWLYWFCLIFIVSSSIILSGFRISTSLTWMSLACEGDAKERMLLAQSKIRRVNLLEIFPEQVWTSEQFGILCSAFWVASRCLVVQKSCDLWLIDPLIPTSSSNSWRSQAPNLLLGSWSFMISQFFCCHGSGLQQRKLS